MYMERMRPTGLNLQIELKTVLARRDTLEAKF